MLFKLKKSFAYCARNYVVIFIRFSSEISFVSAASSSSEVAGHLVCTEDCVCVCVWELILLFLLRGRRTFGVHKPVCCCLTSSSL
jgi:hypothetical protein